MRQSLCVTRSHTLHKIKVKNLAEKEQTCCYVDCGLVTKETCAGLQDDKNKPMIKRKAMTGAIMLQPYRSDDKDIKVCCAKTTTCKDEGKNRLEKLCPAEVYTIKDPLPENPFEEKIDTEVKTNCCEEHGETYGTCESFLGSGLVCDDDQNMVPTRDSTKLQSKIRESEFDKTCCEVGFNCDTMKQELVSRCADMFPIPEAIGLVHVNDVVSKCCREGKSCNDHTCDVGTLPKKEIDSDEKTNKRPQEDVQDYCCIGAEKCPQSVEALNEKCQEYQKIGQKDAETKQAVSTSERA